MSELSYPPERGFEVVERYSCATSVGAVQRIYQNMNMDPAQLGDVADLLDRCDFWISAAQLARSGAVYGSRMCSPCFLATKATEAEFSRTIQDGYHPEDWSQCRSCWPVRPGGPLRSLADLHLSRAFEGRPLCCGCPTEALQRRQLSLFE